MKNIKKFIKKEFPNCPPSFEGELEVKLKELQRAEEIKKCGIKIKECRILANQQKELDKLIQSVARSMELLNEKSTFTFGRNIYNEVSIESIKNCTSFPNE